MAKNWKCRNFKKCGNLCYHGSRVCKSCLDAARAAEQKRKVAEKDALDRRLAAGRATQLDSLKVENTALRSQVSKQETALAGYRSKTRVEDRLVETIKGVIEASPYVPQIAPFVPKVARGKATAHEMLLLLSDAHYPEVVSPAEAFGLSYNGDICLERLQRVRDVTIRYKDLRASSYPTQKLTVAVNGDMLSGTIHEELEVTNEIPITEALVKMAYALFDMGQAFAEEFPKVEFVVMPGNHPRLEKKPRAKQKWNNWEWVLGKFLEALGRQSKAFDVVVPKNLVHVHPIFNRQIGLTHGDGVKAQSFAGIPWYSMRQRREALQSLLKTLGAPQLDMLCYGHFHQLIYEEGQGCSLVINGSIKGGDEYGISTKYAVQHPVQALLTFHPRHGMTDLSRINLYDGGIA